MHKLIMKSLIVFISAGLWLSASSYAASCYTGYKEKEDPDKYYAPDGSSFDDSRECIKYVKEQSTQEKEDSKASAAEDEEKLDSSDSSDEQDKADNESSDSEE